MSSAILYGIGIGPGDPGLITVKGAAILAKCRHVFVPRAPGSDKSLALSIARQHIHPDAVIYPIEFPKSSDPTKVRSHWDELVPRIESVLREGQDVCYLTLGDTMLYSTYVNMLKALRRRIHDVHVITIPGVSSFSAAAALTEISLGEAKRPFVIMPTSGDLSTIEQAIELGGTVILMKIGDRLQDVIELLEHLERLEDAVLVTRAGLEGERIETDLQRLKNAPPDAGHMSIILVSSGSEN
jgi:precorrin-2/cobalt-factor-2 C20-methyltransferase